MLDNYNNSVHDLFTFYRDWYEKLLKLYQVRLVFGFIEVECNCG